MDDWEGKRKRGETNEGGKIQEKAPGQLLDATEYAYFQDRVRGRPWPESTYTVAWRHELVVWAA